MGFFSRLFASSAVEKMLKQFEAGDTAIHHIGSAKALKFAFAMLMHGSERSCDIFLRRIDNLQFSKEELTKAFCAMAINNTKVRIITCRVDEGLEVVVDKCNEAGAGVELLSADMDPSIVQQNFIVSDGKRYIAEPPHLISYTSRGDYASADYCMGNELACKWLEHVFEEQAAELGGFPNA